MKKIKLLIIDNSISFTKMVQSQLVKNKYIKLHSIASEAYDAREKIVKSKPDVICLGLNIKNISSIKFLNSLMKHFPIPVIILTDDKNNQKDLCITAMEYGAVDIINKPRNIHSINYFIEILTKKIRNANIVDINHLQATIETSINKKVIPELITAELEKDIIAIGASTGGVITLEKLISSIKVIHSPILIVIHMPNGFTASFAEHLNTLTDYTVKEAENNEIIKEKTIYIAAGNFHMEVISYANIKKIKLSQGEKVNSCRPAVDILFFSIANIYQDRSIGILLTGIGKDGAEGLNAIKNSGGYTIAQDESTSIVFGMPKAAIELNAVNKILPLTKIAADIARFYT